ncbi:MAG: nucleotidyltransferase family protein [Actinobacteria bacterium]|nr:nucleotidyltransferase family protein [Actinomycetota bacterium]
MTPDPGMASPHKSDHLIWEQGGEFDEATYRKIFGEVVDEIRQLKKDFLVFGGLASSFYGRPRTTHDIDLLVRPQDRDPLLGQLSEAGFDTQRTYPDWIYKAMKEGVLVDIIFRSSGNIYLDDEMVSRGVTGEIQGREVPVIAPEDLIVIKAIAHKENSPRHLHDVLEVLSRQSIDWDYLSRRARFGIRRVLSFLMFASSEGVAIPKEVLGKMAIETYGS